MGKVLKVNYSQVIKIQAENCDVHPGSPIIDVEGMSDENEEEVMEDGQRSSEDHEETSEDQKVLSLAEQFIAAMPARIKNENQSNEGSSANCEGTHLLLGFPTGHFLKPSIHLIRPTCPSCDAGAIYRRHRKSSTLGSWRL